MKAKEPVSLSDWKDAWSPEHPVEVEHGDGTCHYLSETAAVRRLSSWMGWTEDTARHYLILEGQTIVAGMGARYVLLEGPR